MFADLYVIAPVINTERYKSRYTLYLDFEKRCLDAGAKLYTVEAAFGERPHEITTHDKPQHIQLRTQSQIWHKENMVNIAIGRLPSDWKYVAWIDADITFSRPDWVDETIHQLQHFHLVQMFSHVIELGPRSEPVPGFYQHTPLSWGYCYHHRLSRPVFNKTNQMAYGLTTTTGLGGFYWHPGFAWAARREAIDSLGGLFDTCINGGSDMLMATALTRSCDFPPWATTGNFGRQLYEWQYRCDRYIRGNVGYVPGTILHNWHGNKALRKYSARNEILISNDFDPELDLKRDWQGLYQLTDRSAKLRDDLRLYHRERNEDSIDVL